MPRWHQRQQLPSPQGAPVIPTQPPARLALRGMTLVELLVAMTLGLFLIITVVSVYVTTTVSSRVSVLTAQMNEDAALALDMLQEQIRISAFSSENIGGVRNFSGVPLLGCDGGFTELSETAAFDQLACTGGNGADALAVRYEATSLNSQQVNHQPTNQSFPADCTSTSIFRADQGSGVPISLADNRFYIAPDAVNGGTPALFCRGSNGNGGFNNAASLIPNIEDLQLRYAITRSPNNGQVMPHQITANVEASDAVLGNAVLNWSRVAAVHICLVARSAQPVPLGDNVAQDVSRFVDCADVVQTPNDRFLRRSYRSTAYLRNARPAVTATFQQSGGNVLNPYRHLSSSN